MANKTNKKRTHFNNVGIVVGCEVINLIALNSYCSMTSSRTVPN